MNLFLFYAFKFPTLLFGLKNNVSESFWKGKSKRAESTEAAAVLLCESDRGIGLAFACCSSLTPRRSSSGSQTDGAALFISETPTATFSSQRRSGGCVAPQECNERHFSTTCLRYTALSWASNQDAPNVHKLEWHRENNVFLTFLRGHTVLFLAENIRKRVMIKKRKGAGRSLLWPACSHPSQKSAVLTVYQATL